MKNYISFFLLFLISSCNISTTNYNEEDQKEKAEQVTDKFYDAIAKKDYGAAEILFGKEFYKAVSKAQLEDFINQINAKVGDFKSKRLIDWNTTNTTGVNTSVVYILVYEVSYERGKVKEKITLKDIGNGIEIYRYDVL